MSNVKKIRVLIVDDSLLFSETLKSNLNKDPHIEVIATASVCYEALKKIEELNPDVISLDVEMPKMNGIEFLKTLLPAHSVPVVVVSSLPMNALDALDAGAVDFVRKPQSGGVGVNIDIKAFISELAVKIKIASTAHVIKRNRDTPIISNIAQLKSTKKDSLIAIGASTGGTEAILSIIRDLPATTCGIVIVQHMPPGFTQMYATRLNKICKMKIKEAEDYDRVEQGTVLIAAGDYHLTLAKDAKGFYVRSQKGDKVSGHCPSVDVMFESVARVAKSKAIGIILTGMGADGAKGLLKMKQAGSYTIGQDKDSCVVYGMPMVAYNIGGVVKQLPLDSIANDMITYLNNH